MSVLPIRVYGDQGLRRPTEPIVQIDAGIDRLIEDMFDTLRHAEGLGLAANQVGASRSLFIIDPRPLAERGVRLDSRDEPLVVINPVLVKSEGEECLEEGCLSLPGITENLHRPTRVIIRGLDRRGAPIEIVGDKILARAFAHEIDHLQGLFLIDRIVPVRRELLKPRLKELSRRSAGARRSA
jgi:peptide deformylase